MGVYKALERDPHAEDLLRMRKAQDAWLEKELEKTDAEKPAHLVILSHIPPYIEAESLLPASLGHSILCFRTGRKEEVPTACFQTENCTVACSVAVACLFSTIKPLVFKPTSVCVIRSHIS